MPWPSLSKTYCSTVNVAITNTSSAANINANLFWLVKAALMNQLGTPTSGTRHANSVWTCYGSSNGVTAAMDGVDRWGSTFSAASLVRGSSGSVPHSWIVLQNTTLGVQLLIDLLNNTFNVTARVAFTPISTPFTTAATATHSPPTTGKSVSLAQNNDSTSTTGIYWNGENNPPVGTVYRVSFTFDNDGEFYLMFHRKGILGFTGGLIGFRPQGGPATPLIATSFCLLGTSPTSYDTNYNNKGWPYDAGGGLTGVSAYGTLSQAAEATIISIAGYSGYGFAGFYHSGDVYRNTVPNQRPGTAYYSPVQVWDVLPAIAYRGVVPDMYHVTGSGNCASYPSVAAQTHIGTGPYAVPMLGGVPLIG